jgi:hypothetical protein
MDPDVVLVGEMKLSAGAPARHADGGHGGQPCVGGAQTGAAVRWGAWPGVLPLPGRRSAGVPCAAATSSAAGASRMDRIAFPLDNRCDDTQHRRAAQTSQESRDKAAWLPRRLPRHQCMKARDH